MMRLRCSNLLLILFLVFIIFSTGTTVDSEIPPLSEISNDSLSELEAALQNKTLADCIDAWGEPDGSLSGMYGMLWYLSDGDTQLIVYFDNEDDTFQQLKTGRQSVTLLGQLQDGMIGRGGDIRFVSRIEAFNQPVENSEIISLLLGVLEDGAFRAAAAPMEPYTSYEGIMTVNDVGEYRVAVINGEVLMFQLGPNKWFYTSSNTADFLSQLMDFQGR